MGKYMGKPKTTAEVAIMDISHPSLGVLTRAKTLALLQRLQKPPPSSASYLQLRSRRLEKPPTLLLGNQSKRQRSAAQERIAQNSESTFEGGSRLKDDCLSSDSNGSVSIGRRSSNERGQRSNAAGNTFSNGEGIRELSKSVGSGVEEASFGENVLDSEGRDGSTRESTPCSLIRDVDDIRRHGSTTRPANSAEANRTTANSIRRNIPITHEMDEFFAGAEEEQQKQFIEKYNFDPINDKPLPGRYKWEKLDPQEANG